MSYFMGSVLPRVCVVLLLFSIGLSTASAATITIDATDRGWYRDEGFHSPLLDGTVQNYIAGKIFSTVGIDTPRIAEFRNWFVFDVSGVPGTIVDAKLSLRNVIYLSLDDTETIAFHEVSTSINDLTAGGDGLTNIFDDLADGAFYGEKELSANDDASLVEVQLNSEFLALANSQSGLLALGGAITTLQDGDSVEHVFSSTQNRPLQDTQLILIVVPEPASIFILFIASGFIAWSSCRWRNSRSLTFQAGILLLALLANQDLANAATIDFEDGVAHDTPIPSNHYDGLTFTNAVWISVGGAFGEGNFGLGVDAGQIAENNWGFPGIVSPIGIQFDSPVSLVSITAFGVGDQGAQIEAFDSGNNSIALDNSFGIGAGQDNIVALSVAVADIARVELTQHLFRGSDDGVGWDNLVFVPEPSTLTFLAFGAFILFSYRNRKVIANAMMPILAIAILGGVPGSVANGQNVDWSNPSGGQFGEASNWNTGVVPSSTDAARFGTTVGTTSSTVTVDLVNAQQVMNASVVAGDYKWEFGVDGENIEILDSLLIGNDAYSDNGLPNQASLTIASTLANAVVNVGSRLNIGLGDGRTGKLRIDGVELNLLSGPALANATLEVVNAAVLITGMDLDVAHLGTLPNSVSYVSIDGAGSIWHNVDTQFWLGHGPGGGEGFINVTNGGEFQANALLLGNSDFGGRGQINVTGFGSTVRANFTRVISNSLFELFDGAQLISDGSLDIAPDVLGNASVMLRGSETEVKLDDTLWMSGFGGTRGGISLLDVEDASVVVSKNAFLSPSSTIDLKDGSLTIGDATAQVGTVSIANNFILEGSPNIKGSLVNESGRLSPSDFPARNQPAYGSIAIDENLELNGGQLFIEVGDSSDLLSLAGGTAKIGGTLIVDQFDDAKIATGDSFTFLSGFSSISGSFDSIIDRTPYRFRVETSGGVGRLIATIPEPSTTALLTLALIAAGFSGRIKKGSC